VIKLKENKKSMSICIMFTEQEWQTVVKAANFGFSVNALAKNAALSHIERMIRKIEED
jgi:hypothetical protein